MSKLSRGEKGELLVSKTLLGYKPYHHLLNDVTFINKNSEMSHQIDHIFICSFGVFLIETKNYFGEILLENNNWKRRIQNKIEKINNPLLQNKSHAITLRKLIKGKYDIVPVVVFARNNAPYAGDENVINLDDLILFIESYPYKKKLTIDEIDDAYKLIFMNVKQVSKEEHIENISYLKAVNKELRKEKEYAISKGICPRCGAKMNIKGNKFSCPNCLYKFEL